jgi:ketosteroid isomerase-like protein
MARDDADEDRLATLEARLRWLEDLEQIRELRMKYHQFVNDRVVHRLAEIYTEDGVLFLTPAVQATGRDEICALYARIMQNNPLKMQFIGNHMIELNGDEATGFSYLDSRFVGGGVSKMGASRLDETYRRTAEGWRISRTSAHVYFTVPVDADWLGGQAA